MAPWRLTHQGWASIDCAQAAMFVVGTMAPWRLTRGWASIDCAQAAMFVGTMATDREGAGHPLIARRLRCSLAPCHHGD
eukprot:730120-Pyramimonas_sp.AAC.1